MRVIGVVVTYNRTDVLGRSLEILAHQTRPLDHLIVVDNGNDPTVKTLLETAGRNAGLPARAGAETGESAAGSATGDGAGSATGDGADGLPVTYLPSRHNLGGAGGFALGMLHALALGADWVWCADDDGHPDGPDVLRTLLECAQHYHLDQVSPVVCSIDDPNTLAFPLRRGLVWRRKRSELFDEDDPQHQHTLLPGIASLMNGALFSTRCLDTIGVPDLRLFMRGDEVELHRRLERSGLAFGTCLATAYLHPNGAGEFKPILGGRMHAQYPDSPAKRYYTYRNRGFLMAMPGKRSLVFQEYARFSWFFLVQQHDVEGFREWRRLRKLGRAEKLYRLP